MTTPYTAKKQIPTAELPYDRTKEIQKYFSDPANLVKIQFPSPESQYAWQRMSQFYPTARFSRGGAISELEVAIDESIGDISYTGRDGVVQTVSEHFENFPMDAMLVMKEGKIVYERYKTMTPDTTHVTYSATKVFSSTLIALLEDEGKVDLSKPVSDYLQELKGSVWDTVPVRHAADMQTGLNGTEHDEPNPDSRTNPKQIWYRWAATLGVLPNQGEDDPYAVMREMERHKPGGQVFEYNSINPFALARIVERIENRPFVDVFSDRIWSKIGAEHDGATVMSPNGYALAFGFTQVTLRDLARFGALFTPSSEAVTGTTIISQDLVKRIRATGNPAAYTNNFVGDGMTKKLSDDAGKISNAYMWDAIMSDGDMFKGGTGGQGLYVSPSRNLVAVWFTTGDGEEWHEAMGRAISLSFD